MSHQSIILKLFPDLATDPTALAFIAISVIGASVWLLFLLSPKRERRHHNR
ncbi:MAG: hypothetical protein HDQ87_03150 [Clostridia bacterium]|nr:hypothetical protein [Clostridia bacterium]